MSVVAWYWRRDGDGWPAFLLTPLVASTSVKETCRQGDEIDAQDDNDGNADWIRPVKPFVLLAYVSLGSVL